MTVAKAKADEPNSPLATLCDAKRKTPKRTSNNPIALNAIGSLKKKPLLILATSASSSKIGLQDMKTPKIARGIDHQATSIQYGINAFE